MPGRLGRSLKMWAVPGLLLVVFPCTTQALPPELWVVDENSREISIIDDILDTPATIETIDLGGPPAAQPYGIAFSTVEQMPGAHAFVSQGAEIRVIEHATRDIVATCDVGAWMGVSEVFLKGMDAARPEHFLDPLGPRVTRSYLHVAANVRPDVTDDLIPWYIVLDQVVLTDIALPCDNAVVAHGPLALPQAVPQDAMEVRVLGSPAGEKTQRAWYTFRELSATPMLAARLVVGGPALDSPWEALETITIDSPGGVPIPESIHPGAPHSRELPLLPDAPNGELLRLDTGERCGLGDIPRAVAVAGPGFGSYDIWTAKLNTAGGNDLLQRSKWDMCAPEPPLTIGVNPVDVETWGRVEAYEVYVANHDSDDVSVVLSTDPTTVHTIQLADSPGGCVKCPRSLAVQETPESICRAIELEIEPVNNDQELFHTWNGVGCENNGFFKVWCKCLSHEPLDCPTDCRPPIDGGGRPGEIWVEIDVVTGSGNDGGTINTSNDGSANTEKNIEANGS